MSRRPNPSSALALALALALCALLAPPLRSADKEQVRAPAVAGSFYPADRAQLEKTVDELLARAGTPAISEPLVALVAPHAGYPYSGAVAGQSFALLKGRKYQRVVVIAPSHFEAFDFSSVYDGDAYATPLGPIPVDKAFAGRLAAMDPKRIRLSQSGHAPAGEQGEHALEVELPFLQRTLGQFQLVPIVMGDQSYQSSRALGVALAKLIQGGDTLIVASSDLSHYHPTEQASAMDHKTLAAIADWDTLSLSGNFEARVWEACGGAPIVAAMIAAQRMGATEARVLKYENSGDVTGERSRVVGYGAVALLRGGRAARAAEFSLSGREQQELLRIARQAAEMAVKDNKLYQPSVPTSPSLLQERGAFVTLRMAGGLRGCIGYTAAMKPLYLTVRDVTVYAALRDPRFPPVTPEELGRLDYEVSVLSPFRQVLDVKQIQVGRDGLLLRKGNQDGVLLPQVPVEQGWDRKRFLEEAAVKAGLPPGAWKDEDTDIFAFTALIFPEPKAPEFRLPEPPSARPTRPGPPGTNSPPR